MNRKSCHRGLFALVLLMLALPLPAFTAEAAPPGPDRSEQLRRQLTRYFANLRESSPTVLARSGVDPEIREMLRQRIAAMSREELEELSQGFSQVPNWQIAPEALASALPAATREQLNSAGLRLASRAGEATAFRDEVASLASFVGMLSPATLKQLGLSQDDVEAVRRSFAAMSPLQAAMLQERLPAGAGLQSRSAAVLAAMPESLREGLGTLSEHGPLSEEEKAALKRFAGQVEALLAGLRELPPEARKRFDAAKLDQLAQRVAGATPETLFILREQVGEQEVLRALAAVKLLNSFAALTETERQELEAFRTDLRSALTAAGSAASQEGTPLTGFDKRLAELLRHASPSQLALIEDTYKRLPQDVDPAAMAVVPIVAAVNIEDCSKEIAGVNISFNFICDPLEDAINSVADSVDDVVKKIGNKVNDIWDFLQPDSGTTLLGEIKKLFKDLLDEEISGHSLLDLTDPETLHEALDLGASFWEDLPEVPQTPCPPEGTQIPFFGEVGEGETAAKYSRYKWLFDKLLELIPDTEISLEVKIPAQFLYAGVEYLEICLEAAAEERDSQETAAFRSEVNGSLSNSLSNEATILQSIASLSGQVAIQGTELSEQIDTFQQLDLRLDIEQNLLASEGAEIARFQLPEPWGYLDLVREVVRGAIDDFLDAGQPVNPLAEKEFGVGDADLTAGNYKSAYTHFQKAYRAAVKK
jgi:hypothetical protein